MNEKSFVIGFSNLDETNPFSVKVRKNLQKAAEQYPHIELVVRDNDMNSDKARAHVAEFLEIPVDLAIIYHIDERANPEIVAPLRKRNIPIIAIDIPVQTFGTTFFGINISNAGQMAGDTLGEWIEKKWASKVDKVIVFIDHRILDIFRERFEVALSALASRIEIDHNSVLYADNGGNRTMTANRLTGILNNWSDIHHIAVICMNDKIASGVLSAARELNREQDLAVLSFDGTDYAQSEFLKSDSRLIVSPSFQPEEYGKELIKLSLQILQGERIPPQVYVEPICLKRDDF